MIALYVGSGKQQAKEWGVARTESGVRHHLVDAQQRCALDIHVRTCAPLHPLTFRLDGYKLRCKIEKFSILAAVGGTGVLESTSDLYRRGS